MTYDVQATIPQPQRRRPRWLVPVIAVGLVLLVAAAVALTVSLTGGDPTAAPSASSTLPGDQAARDACEQLSGDDAIPADFPVMMRIGDRAGESSVAGIRTSGRVLHDLAVIAANGPDASHDLAGALNRMTDVTNALTELVKACGAAGIRLH